MPESLVTYFGQHARVACDGNCSKAWGINSRPRHRTPGGGEDDYVYCADSELGEAPADPGTYEGGHAKPASSAEFPNRWCVRECERCAISKPGAWRQLPELPDLEHPQPNTCRSY